MILVLLASTAYATYEAFLWLGMFTCFFGMHLNMLGALDGVVYGRSTLGKLSSHLRIEAMVWGGRRVLVWVAGTGAYVCVLVWCIVTFSRRDNGTTEDSALITLLIAQALATLYAPWYYDHSELTGLRTWPWLRELRLWRVISRVLFGLKTYRVRNRDNLDDHPPHLFWRRDRDCWREGPSYCMATADVVDTHAYTVAYHKPHRLVREVTSCGAEEEGGAVRIYVMHPHGLSTVAGIFGAAMHGPVESSSMPHARRVRLCVARILLWVPLLRDWCLWCGCLEASHLAIHINTKVSRHYDLVILPGGLVEQALSRPGYLDVVWQRTGFIRAAVASDARLVPVCVLGESYTYATLPQLAALRLLLYRLCGVPLPAPFIGPIPSASLSIVIGQEVVPRAIDPGASPDAETHKLQSPVQARIHFLGNHGADDESGSDETTPTRRAVRLMRIAFYADLCDLYMLSIHALYTLRARDGSHVAIEAPGPSMRNLMRITKRNSRYNTHITEALSYDDSTRSECVGVDPMRWASTYRWLASSPTL